MTALEIKGIRKEVKQYIDHADGRMLKAIHAMLEADQHKAMEIDNSSPDAISDGEMAAIERGLKQLDNGGGVPHNEAIKRLKWFPK